MLSFLKFWYHPFFTFILRTILGTGFHAACLPGTGSYQTLSMCALALGLTWASSQAFSHGNHRIFPEITWQVGVISAEKQLVKYIVFLPTEEVYICMWVPNRLQCDRQSGVGSAVCRLVGGPPTFHIFPVEYRHTLTCSTGAWTLMRWYSTPTDRWVIRKTMPESVW